MAELDDKVIVTKSKITDIADALREEMSESNEYSLPTMVQKVHELGQGQGSEYTAGVGIDITNRVVSVVDTLMIRGSANGSVASIDDGADDIPLKSCMVYIEPVQSGSGDPSPSNVRPISGWTECNITVADGENLWDEQWEAGSINAQGEKVGSENYIRTKNYTFLKPSTTYYFYCGSASVGREVFFYDINKTFISYQKLNANGTFATPTNAKYMLFTMYRTYGNTYNNDISINYPSTDTDYHAYKGNTYNIEFPSEAGTVYGGTLDVTNGVLTVDRVMVLGGDLTWQKSSSGNKYTARIQNNPYKFASDIYFICERYKNDGIGNATRGYYGADGTFRYYYSQGATAISEFYVTDDNQTSLADFETAIENVKFVYELATPQTYNLTPTEIKTLLGINNIFADCGDVDVEYVRDATLIINKLLELVSVNNNRTMMKSAVVEKTDEVQEQKKDSVEEDLDA